MRGRAFFCVLAVVLAAGGALRALETASAQMERERATSAPDAVSLKPLFLFDMRGRKDPFMDYALLTNAVTPGKTFTINELVFSGTIEVAGQTVALFRDDLGKSYFLRGSSLYDPQDKVVAGVRGSVLESGGNNNQVVLTQGESKLAFSYQRMSKRLAADSQP